MSLPSKLLASPRWAFFFLFAVVQCVFSLRAFQEGFWPPLVIFDFSLMVFLFAQRVSWRLSFSYSLLISFGSFALWIQFSALMPGSYEQKIFILSNAVFLIVWMCLLRIKLRTSFKLSHVLSGWKAALAFTITGLVILIIAVEVRAPDAFAWAMNEDAVWNTVTARYILADQGFVPSLHPHSAPITPNLMAAAMSFGRNAHNPETLLSSDVQNIGVLWLLLTAAMSVVGLMIAVSLIPDNQKNLQFGFGIVGALVPWLWGISGWIFALGYVNATVSLLLLMALWAVWVYSQGQFNIVFIACASAGIALLATWAPLAAIPCGLLVVSAIRFALMKQNDSAQTRSRRVKHLIVLVIASSSILLYAVFVSLKDISREKGALSFDGGMFNFHWWHFMLLVLIAGTCAIVFILNSPPLRLIGWGSLALLISSLVSLTYLLFQRRGMESLWGYYPAKMSWIVSSALFFMSVSFVGFISSHFLGGIKRIGFIALSSLLVGAGLFLVKPPSIVDIFAPVNMLFSTGIAQNNALVSELSSMAGKDTLNVVFDLNTVEQDRFENMWLLQLPSIRGDDPLRSYAYYLSKDAPLGLCEIDRLNPVETKVHTRNAQLESQLDSLCPQNSITVVLH